MHRGRKGSTGPHPTATAEWRLPAPTPGRAAGRTQSLPKASEMKCSWKGPH